MPFNRNDHDSKKTHSQQMEGNGPPDYNRPRPEHLGDHFPQGPPIFEGRRLGKCCWQLERLEGPLELQNTPTEILFDASRRDPDLG